MGTQPAPRQHWPGSLRDLAVAAFEDAPTAGAIVELTDAAHATVREVNRAMCELVGLSRVELVGKCLTDLIDGADDVIDQLADGASVLGAQAECVRANGQRVAILVHAAVLRGRSDPPALAVLQAKALTTPLFAERQRGETEKRLQDLADGIGAAVYIKGSDGRYLMSNRRFEQMVGVSREDLRGMTDYDVFPPEMAARYVENDKSVLASGESTDYEEPLANGELWLSTKFRLEDDDGTPYAVGGISANISERSRAEAAIRRAKDEAERANRAKSEFLSRMSHELRTPLNSILGFGQLLQMEQLPPDASESADRIVKAGRHLLALINEVLEISRIEPGGHQMSLEPVHAAEPLTEALEFVRPLAANRGIEVVRDLHAGLYRFVLADYQRLTQVLLNILANAVKYNREGGTVSVAFESIGRDRLRFRITDTGHGIDERDVDKVFVAFERLGAAATETEGTGLGLALSKSIIEAMGGAIGVERTGKGKGTVFFVDLPLTDAPTHASGLVFNEEAAAVFESVDLRDGTVVYIEDNVANLQLLQRVFARVGRLRLIPAMQGQLGIELAAQHQPDLILLDLHLPDLDGDEVLRRLRADTQTRDIPIIVLSADATPAQIERLKAAGAEDYLTKPLDIPSFLEAVERVLGAASP